MTIGFFDESRHPNFVKLAACGYANVNCLSVSCRSYGIDIKDFGSSWRDGKAFVAIVHCINPTCIDVNASERMATQDRLDNVFKVLGNAWLAIRDVLMLNG